MGLLAPLQASNTSERSDVAAGGKPREERMRWVSGLDYRGHTLQWMEYTGQVQGGSAERHCHLSDLPLKTAREAWELSRAARLRWKVENEGFNTQKNGGYAMQHKYSRHHPMAQRNYYHLMQIAHLINQLTEKIESVKDRMKQAGTTVKAVVEDMVATLRTLPITEEELSAVLTRHRQLRY